MKYKNTTNHVIMVPVAGELQAVASGAVIDLLYASSPGLAEVKSTVTKPKAKAKAILEWLEFFSFLFVSNKSYGVFSPSKFRLGLSGFL